MTLEVGDTAPDFEFERDGTSLTLYSLLENGPVIIYFYPKDFTGGCTIQAKGFRDSYPAFQQVNAEVVGVSADKDETHCKFRDSHDLPFPLAADPKREIAEAYGVKCRFGLIPERVTFVVGQDQRLIDVYKANLRFIRHVEHSLQMVRSYSEGRKLV